MLCTAMALLSVSVHSTTLAMTNSYMPLQEGHNSDWSHHDICIHIVTRPFLFDGLQYQFYCYEGQMSIFVCISLYISVYTVVKRANLNSISLFSSVYFVRTSNSNFSVYHQFCVFPVGDWPMIYTHPR